MSLPAEAQGLPLDTEKALEILHAEAVHVSERHEQVMQGQERVLTVAMATIGAGIAFAAQANQPEVFLALPFILAGMFSFLLVLYADAHAKKAYLEYLHSLINVRLEPVKLALLNERPDYAHGHNQEKALMYVEVAETRSPRRNVSQTLGVVLWGAVLVSLSCYGWIVALSTPPLDLGYLPPIPVWALYLSFMAFALLTVVKAAWELGGAAAAAKKALGYR